MNIILPGQYPRSESLVAATRQFDRNRISFEQLRAMIKEEERSLYQSQSDLKYRSTGLFLWQDLLRPFEEIMEEAGASTLIRFYETNLFWRELQCNGKWSLRTGDLERWIDKWFFSEGMASKEEPLVFTLPFLFLLRMFAKDMSCDDAADILKVIARKLLGYPNKVLYFLEPTIGWNPLTLEEKRKAVEFLKEIKSFSSNLIFLGIPFFSLDTEKTFLFQLPVDGIGIDFYGNAISILKDFPKDKILIAGILNTSSTEVETPEQFDGFKNLLEKIGFRNEIYYTASGIQELLPRVIMDKKLKALKEWIHASSFVSHP